MKRLFNDEAGVSPIVATLVLVVVAIAGAAAVGTILGSFSSDVSGSASVGDSALSASAELIVAGSTTVEPVSQLLAKEFMAANPGIKVTVQAGGSGAGKTATEMGVIDIGGVSEAVDTVTAHPTLQVYQIGASAVVPITKGVTHITPGGMFTADDFKKLYENTTAAGSATVAPFGNFSTTSGNITVYQREEVGSGSEECFSFWATGSKTGIEATKAKMASGNPGVLNAVATTANSVGFVDVGLMKEAPAGVTIMDVCGKTSFTDVDGLAKKQLKGEASTFPKDLTRPLNYVTLGQPSTLEQSFIDFATQPAQKGVFTEVGYFSMYDI